jgi:hypothetical protein
MSIYQAALTVNFPYDLELQGTHIAYIIERALREDIRTLEVSEEAEAEWVQLVVEKAENAKDFNDSCTPGYYNAEGQANAKTRRNSFYISEPTEYAERLAAWREEGSMAGLVRG